MTLRKRICFEQHPARVAAYVKGGYWPGQTLKNWIERWGAEQPDKVALRGLDGVLTYRELRDRSRAFARGLETLGIEPGDVVAIQLQNTQEFVIAYLGIGLC